MTESAIWRGGLGTYAAAPALNLAKGGFCSAVLLSPRVALTDQHCEDVLKVTDDSGTTKYAYLVHPQSPLWNGDSNARVTGTWAPPDWTTGERTRDLRILTLEDNEAPLTVFPPRVRYFDSAPLTGFKYPSDVAHALPVAFMGWGKTHEEMDGQLYEQWEYSFGNELGLTAHEGTQYRGWKANLGPFRDYVGPGSGDSGGPLLRQLSMDEPLEFELLGLNGGLTTNANGDDPRYTQAQLDAMTKDERSAAYADEIKYSWADLTNPTFLQALHRVAGDNTRPGRLLGERDYYGPARTDLDPDGDHFYGTATASCPLYLYDQKGEFGELRAFGNVSYWPDLATGLPALHAYRSLLLNDRTRVYDPLGGWGTVVLGSHESSLLDDASIGGRIGTDSRVGKLYAEGGGSLALAERSKVGQAWWTRLRISAAEGSEITNTPGQSAVMRVPQSRLIKAFPPRILGWIPDVATIADASYWYGTCKPGIVCNVFQSIEPDKSVTLPAGYFGDLSVKSRSKLTLSGGDYFFDSLTMESESRLLVAAGASARVWVRDSLTLRNEGNLKRGTDPDTGTLKVTDASAAANLFIGYYGLGDVYVRELTSTLLAPYASVIMDTNHAWATAHAGMVVANRIELHQGNSFYHVPYRCR